MESGLVCDNSPHIYQASIRSPVIVTADSWPRRRYGVRIEGDRVLVGGPDGPVDVGSLERIVAAVGGPAWEVNYPDDYDGDRADEGLVVDVSDTIRAMEHDGNLARALSACPDDRPESGLSHREALFVGHLLSQLQGGLS